ncbi:MAG: NAD-dependent epimerase/dehydratase family protein [Solirubrobacteraceae bacterium]
MLVTGASGFVGARVVSLALRRGYSVTALVRPATDVRRLAPFAHDVEIVSADIADSNALQRVVTRLRPRACVHLAAAGAVVRADDLQTLLAVNAEAPATLAAALGRVGAECLVTAGSSSEYGPVDGRMEETLPALPADAYGVTKLAGGLLAALTGARYGLATAHLRLFSVYGPGEDPRRLVAAVVDSVLAGRPIALTPGAQVRDFVYVDDVAEALLAAVDRAAVDGITINIGTGVETTVRDVCHMIADLLGGHELLRFGDRPYRSGERFHWRASTDRATKLLGWRARTSLSAGLAATVAESCAEPLVRSAA